MQADSFLNIKDFILEPYHENHDGDSGALYLATAKSEPSNQYIVKSARPELACNEFMYHKTASAIGVYTQDAKLFLPNSQFRYAAGIRYEKAARKAHSADLSPESLCFVDFIGFETLYVILNEEDSQEYYFDSNGRLFKLDNAASFNIGAYEIAMLGAVPEEDAMKQLKRTLDFTEYGKYPIILQILTERYGDVGRQASLAMFERFSHLDMSVMEEAVDDLSQIYPLVLAEYYFRFFENRKALCTKFLAEVKGSSTGT